MSLHGGYYGWPPLGPSHQILQDHYARCQAVHMCLLQMLLTTISQCCIDGAELHKQHTRVGSVIRTMAAPLSRVWPPIRATTGTWWTSYLHPPLGDMGFWQPSIVLPRKMPAMMTQRTLHWWSHLLSVHSHTGHWSVCCVVGHGLALLHTFAGRTPPSPPFWRSECRGGDQPVSWLGCFASSADIGSASPVFPASRAGGKQQRCSSAAPGTKTSTSS